MQYTSNMNIDKNINNEQKDDKTHSKNAKVFSCTDINTVLMDLAKKAISVKRKILIVLDSKDRLDTLSIKFWNSRTFLPHGTQFDTEHQEKQFIFLILQNEEESISHNYYNNPVNRIYVNPKVEFVKAIQSQQNNQINSENQSHIANPKDYIFLYDSMYVPTDLESQTWPK